MDCLEPCAGFPPLHVTVLAVDRENPWIFLPPSNKRPHPSPTPSSSSAHSRSSGRTPQGAVFTDASSATYALYSNCSSTLVSACLPNSLPPPCTSSVITAHSDVPGSSDLPFIPDFEDEKTAPGNSSPSSGSDAGGEELVPHPSVLGRARGASALIFVPASNDYMSIGMLKLIRLHIARVPAKLGTAAGTTVKVGDDKEQRRKVADGFEEQTMKDITRNFYELAVLARVRWKLGGRSGNGLPFHLAALDTMRMVLAGEMD